MKQKYYLRGIGVGILFSSIVLLVAYIVSGRGRMSDQDVIKRAEELGMVTTESPLSALSTTENLSAVTTEATTEGTTTEATTEATTDATATEASTEITTTEATTETATTEATTEATPEATTKASTEATTERPGTGNDKVTFTIVGGMDSYSVAKVLEDRGVIRDAADFDNYLEQNGYSSRISTGEYTIQKGTDYETIANMLTGGH